MKKTQALPPAHVAAREAIGKFETHAAQCDTIIGTLTAALDRLEQLYDEARGLVEATAGQTGLVAVEVNLYPTIGDLVASHRGLRPCAASVAAKRADVLLGRLNACAALASSSEPPEAA